MCMNIVVFVGQNSQIDFHLEQEIKRYEEDIGRILIMFLFIQDDCVEKSEIQTLVICVRPFLLCLYILICLTQTPLTGH